MNPIDFVLLILLGVLVFVGVLKGMTRILIGIGALVAAFVLAAQLHQPVADKLAFLDLPGEAIKLISYVLIFLGTMLAGAMAAFLMRKLLRAAMLTWADRLAGGALGLVAASGRFGDRIADRGIVRQSFEQPAEQVGSRLWQAVEDNTGRGGLRKIVQRQMAGGWLFLSSYWPACHIRWVKSSCYLLTGSTASTLFPDSPVLL